jgi:hypothetical protein
VVAAIGFTSILYGQEPEEANAPPGFQVNSKFRKQLLNRTSENVFSDSSGCCAIVVFKDELIGPITRNCRSKFENDLTYFATDYGVAAVSTGTRISSIPKVEGRRQTSFHHASRRAITRVCDINRHTPLKEESRAREGCRKLSP